MKTYRTYLSDGRFYEDLMGDSYHSKYVALMYKFLAFNTTSRIIRVESTFGKYNRLRRRFYKVIGDTAEDINVYHINSKNYSRVLSAGTIKRFLKNITTRSDGSTWVSQ